MSLRAERALARVFADAAPRRFGTGWISGVLAVALGVLCVAAVLCLHFPQFLTMPELRSRYPLPLVRAANNGITAVIDPYGRSLVQLAQDEIAVADSPLPLALAPTPYARLGRLWVPILLILLAGSALVLRGPRQ